MKIAQMSVLGTLVFALCITVCGTVSRAAPLNIPVPSDLIVSSDGYEWVWASPCSGGCSTIDLSYQSQFGWGFVGEPVLALRPSPQSFLFDVNGPQSGSNLRCASPYFDNTYSHCDYGDFVAGFVTSLPNFNAYETLLAREIAQTPLPAALPLFGSSLGIVWLVNCWRRRRANAVV